MNLLEKFLLQSTLSFFYFSLGKRKKLKNYSLKRLCKLSVPCLFSVKFLFSYLRKFTEIKQIMPCREPASNDLKPGWKETGFVTLIVPIMLPQTCSYSLPSRGGTRNQTPPSWSLLCRHFRSCPYLRCWAKLLLHLDPFCKLSALSGVKINNSLSSLQSRRMAYQKVVYWYVSVTLYETSESHWTDIFSSSFSDNVFLCNYTAGRICSDLDPNTTRIKITFIWIANFYWVILRGAEPMWRLGCWLAGIQM